MNLFSYGNEFMQFFIRNGRKTVYLISDFIYIIYSTLIIHT